MGISLPTIRAAIASLNDKAFLSNSKTFNKESRDYVFETLQSAGHTPVPSYTSFMIFPIEMGGKRFIDEMLSHQVGIRAFEFFDKSWCRVSMGTMDEMKTFTSALTKVLS
jgi:histidinol-phosphate aminotransferase